MDITALKNFKIDLTHATSLQQANTALKNYLLSLTITTFAYTYYSYHPNSINKIKYDHCSENYKLWHDYYLSDSCEEVDSTLDEVYYNTLPIFWNLQEQLENSKNERERRMRMDGIKFGAKQGLSIPIHGPHEDFAILLVVQMKGESCLEDWESLQPALLAAAHYYYMALQKLLIDHQPVAERYHLSQREMQCLLLTAKKLSVPQIAKQLMITERTVNFHIQKANKKLGTKNKHQSVNKALEKQLLSL